MSNQSTAGFVYLIRSDSGHYKIGKAKDPNKRVGEFTLQLPFKVQIVHVIKCDNYSRVERTLHRLFQDDHVNGEWFTLNDALVAWLKEWHFFSVDGLRAYIEFIAKGYDLDKTKNAGALIEMKGHSNYIASQKAGAG